MPGTNGKRRQLRRRGFPTKKAAQAELTAVLSEVHRGAYVRPSRMTLGMYLTERWLPARRVDLRASTDLGCEKLIASRIVSALGNVPLNRIDAAMLEAFYGDLLKSGGRNGAPLAAKTVANTAGLLSIALADAVRLKLIPHNPATDARLPRRPRREMTAWTEVEAAAFLASVSSDRLFPLWRLALATGLR